MKRQNNLFSKITDLNNIHIAYKTSIKTKRNRLKILNLEFSIQNLSCERPINSKIQLSFSKFSRYWFWL